MLTRYVALVSETLQVKLPDLAIVAAALQKQVTRDFGPIWGIQANVSVFDQLEHVPVDYWPIVVKDNLDRPEAAGYHEDHLGEPLALVRVTDDWSVTASHEMMEMLADPWGRNTVAGHAPPHSGDRVKFLVEVCDPCSESPPYKINEVEVADFYTPQYFDPVAAPSTRYSFTGAITSPRQVLEGGYLTWYNPRNKEWWHRSWLEGNQARNDQIPTPRIVNGNIRAAVDGYVAQRRDVFRQAKAEHSRRHHHHDQPHEASAHRAKDLRQFIDATIAGPAAAR